MAGQKLCIRNKFGYCKLNRTCQFKHTDKVCETPNCDKSCEERHPKECWYYTNYNRCKFRYCAYKHTEKQSLTDDIRLKIEAMDKKIKEKELEIKLQEQKIKEIETKQENIELETKVLSLETKVTNLERFVLHFQEKFENIDSENSIPTKYDHRESGWAVFDPLVRRPSMEHKCEECDYVGRNAARLKTHIEVKHMHLCSHCTDRWNVGDTIFKTKEEFLEHNRLVHENTDQELTTEEFENLSSHNLKCIKDGKDTPRRKDVREKYNLRLKQTKLNL